MVSAARNCFEVALATAEEIPGATIVHGIARLRKPGPDQGNRYWHAWVEVGGVAIDRSHGHDAWVLVDRYYELGEISETWRFTVVEAAREMVAREHYGPWVDGWEQKVDVIGRDRA